MSGLPLEYDDPIQRVEWGVVINGEAITLPTEELARLTAQGRSDVTLLRREVTYQPWVVVPHLPTRNPHDL